MAWRWFSAMRRQQPLAFISSNNPSYDCPEFAFTPSPVIILINTSRPDQHQLGRALQ